MAENNNDLNLQIGTLLKLSNADLKTQLGAIQKQIQDKLEINVTLKIKGVEAVQKQMKEATATTASDLDNLANKMGAAREKSMLRVREQEKKDIQAQAQAQNKAIEDRYKNEQKAQREIEQAFIKTEQRRREEIEKTERLQTQAINKNLEASYRANQRLQQQEQQRIARLNDVNAPSSSVRIYDPLQQQSVQSGMENRLSGLQSRIGSVARNGNGIINPSQLAQVNQQYAELESRIGRISNNRMAQQWNTDYARLNQQVRGLNGAIEEGSRGLRGYFGNLGMIVKKFADWIIVGNLVMGVMRQFQDAVTYIKEMDTALNGIAKVTTFSTQRLNEMKDTAIEMGKELGHSSIDIMKAQAEFARIAKDPTTINTLTKAAVVASNVTTMSAESAAKALNLTMLSYKMSAKDSMKILDMWNEIQNNFRVSGEDLADSISKTGAAAKQAGVSLEQLLGYTTAIVSSSGITGSEAGTAIKSMTARLFRIGPEGEEDAGKSEEVLGKLGIAVRKNEKEFRSFHDIMKDVNKEWSKWDNITQNNVAQTIAGTYHYSKFINVQENFETASKAMTTALNSQGSAMREQAVYSQTLEGKLGTLKSTLEAMYDKLLKSNNLSGLITTVTLLVNTFGNVKSILTILTAAFVVFYRVAIVDTITAIGKFAYVLMGTVAVEGSATVATNLLSSAFQRLKAISMSSWIGILVTGFTMITGALMLSTAKAEENRKQALEDIKTKQTQQLEIYKLTKQYEDIYKVYLTDKSVKDQLITVEGNLKDAIGETSKSLDLQNGKIDENIAKIRNLSKEKAASDFNNLKFEYDKASEFLTTPRWGESVAPEKELEGLKKVRDNMNKEYDEGKLSYLANLKRGSINKEIEDLEKKISDNRNLFNQGNVLKSIADGTYKFPETITPNDRAKTPEEIAKEAEMAAKAAAEADKKKGDGTPHRNELSVSNKSLEQDRYADLKMLDGQIKATIELNKADQENAKTIEEKNKLIREEITLRESNQKVIAANAKELRAEMKELESTLSGKDSESGMSFGFQFSGEGDNRAISNKSKRLKEIAKWVDELKNSKDTEAYQTRKNFYENAEKYANRYQEIYTTDLTKQKTQFNQEGKTIYGLRNDIDKNITDELFKKQEAAIEPLNQSLKTLKATYDGLYDTDHKGKIENINLQLEEQGKIYDELNKEIEDLGKAWWQATSQEEKDRIHKKADDKREELTTTQKGMGENLKSKNSLKVDELFAPSKKTTEAYDLANAELELKRKMLSSDEETKLQKGEYTKEIELNTEAIKLNNKTITEYDEQIKKVEASTTSTMKKDKDYTNNLQELIDKRNALIVKNKEYEELNVSITKNLINQLIKKEKDIADEKIKIQEKAYDKKSKDFDAQFHEKQKQYDDQVRQQERDYYEKNKALEEKERQHDRNISGAEKLLAVSNIQQQIRDYNAQAILANTQLITQFDTQLSQMNSMSEIKRKDVELLQKQLDLERSRIELVNVENERNVRVLRKDSSGKYSWQYEADQTKIMELKERLGEQELQLQQYNDEQALKNERQTLEDSKRIIDDKNHYISQSLEDEKRAFDEQMYYEKLAIENQRLTFEEHYGNIDKLAHNAFVELQKTYNNDWNSIITTLQEKVQIASAEYSKLLGYLNAPTPSFSTQAFIQQNKAANAAMGNASYGGNDPALTAMGIGGKTRVYDSGGSFPSGSVGINLSGSDERILSPAQTRSFDKLISFLPKLPQLNVPSFAGMNYNMPEINSETYTFNDVIIQANSVESFIKRMKEKIRSN